MTTNEFVKYSSIKNSYEQKFINYVLPLNIKEWVISEKIHGCNSSIAMVSGSDNILLAKRSGYLEENEKFYNLDKIVANMTNLKDHFKKVIKKYNYSSVEVFGETFGGSYPHPDVPAVKNAIKAQKGVFYTPDNNFLAFDIKVDGEYVDALKFQTLCAELEIPYIPIEIFSGNVEEAVAYCDKVKVLPSKIHELYNLPEIENNIREGVVLKPVVTAVLGKSRVIIKCKTDEFLEITTKEPKVKVEFPEEVQEVFNRLLQYASENRLNNVISHLGEVTIKDFGTVMGEFVKDIYTDFLKDTAGTLPTFEKSVTKDISKRLTSQVAPMVRKALMENS